MMQSQFYEGTRTAACLPVRIPVPQAEARPMSGVPDAQEELLSLSGLSLTSLLQRLTLHPCRHSQRRIVVSDVDEVGSDQLHTRQTCWQRTHFGWCQRSAGEETPRCRHRGRVPERGATC